MNECNREQNKVSRRKTRYEKVKGFFDSLGKYIVLIMTFPLDIVGAILKKLFGFMDETNIIPRIALIIGVALTLYVFQWAFMFVQSIPKGQLSGADIAAIVVAVLTPIAGIITILLRFGKSGTVEKEEDKHG